MNLQDAVVLAKDFHNTFDPLEVPVPIKKLKSYLLSKELCDCTVFARVGWVPKLIYGRVRRYEKDGKIWAEIVVSDSLNQCWTRFISCKELVHLFVGNCDEDPIEQIRSAMEPFVLEVEVSPEKWAIVAAIEFLIPWRTRGDILSMIEAGKLTYDIASHYRVPERIIDMWRSPKYQKMMEKLWDGMEIEHERIAPDPA